MSDTEVKIFGCDISHWQGTQVPFDKLKADGVSFIICKATDGAHGIDANYSDNIQKIKDNAIFPGAYHFYEPGIAGDIQANHFMDTVGDDCQNIILALDFEKYGVNPEKDIANAELFITTIKAKYPKAKLMFYSYHAFTSIYNIDEDSPIRTCLQWIARYSSQLPIINYGEPLAVWQKSQSYNFDGGGQQFDYDIVMLSNADWYNWVTPPTSDSTDNITAPVDPPAGEAGQATPDTRPTAN